MDLTGGRQESAGAGGTPPGTGAPAGVLVDAERFWRREVEVHALRGGSPAAYGARPLGGVVAGLLLAVVVAMAPTVVELVRSNGGAEARTGQPTVETPGTTEGPGEPGPPGR